MTRGRVRLRRRQASQASSWPASVSWRPDAPGESEACNLLVRCASSRHLWPNARVTNTTSEWTLQRRLRSGNGTAARSLRSLGGTVRAIHPHRTERAAPRGFFPAMPIAPPLSAASAACSSTKKESQCRLQSCPAQSGSAIRREGAVSERCCQWWSHYCWHSVLDSLSRQQLAELNYVLARWGQSGGRERQGGGGVVHMVGHRCRDLQQPRNERRRLRGARAERGTIDNPVAARANA